MRREWIGIILAVLLLLPASLMGQTEASEEASGQSETQCRKRILVYLDVSGSMKAHYQKGLDGLEALLREPDFTGPTDTVTLVQFGRDRGLALSGEGPGDISALIGRLRTEVSWSNETDFRAAFDHLAKELPKGVYNRQVVLFVSDFAHETVDGMSADAAIADWTGALSQARAGLGDRLSSSRKTKMLLFKAPPTGRTPAARKNREDTAARVIADLQASFSAKESIGNSADLARDLLKNLLDPPDLQVSRDPTNTSQFRFTVTNPNCYALNVIRISVEPTSGGEAEVYEIQESEGKLPRRSEPKPINRPIPRGDEWRTSEVKASVETREGVIGESEDGATTGSWLKYRAVGAVFERRLWPLDDVLRLDLELTGYTDSATTTPYVITFGEDASRFAQGRFEAPVFSASDPKEYRVVLPMARDGETTEAVRVKIGDFLPLATGGDRVRLVEDTVASHRNKVLFVTAFLVLISCLGIALTVYNCVKPYPLFRQPSPRALMWVGVGGLALIVLASALARVWQLRALDPIPLEERLGYLVGVVLFLLSILLVHRLVQARFARDTARGNFDVLKKYVSSGRMGGWGPLVAGLVVAGLFVFFWLRLPPESQEMRRAVKPAALHVTTD